MALTSRNCALHRIATATAAFAFVLLALGGLVTASNSGLGCGAEWPLCRSAFVPPVGDVHAWIEAGHRLMAAIVSVGVAACAVLAWRARRGPVPVSVAAWRLALVACGLILLEILLGMATVLLSLPAWVVAVHMADAATLVGVLAGLARATGARSLRTAAQPVPGRAGAALWASGVAAVATAALGSYVTHSDAASLCRSGLACVGQIGAPGGGGLLIVLAHVLLALALGALLMALARGAGRALPRFVALVAGGYALQVVIGVALLASGLDPFVLLVHEVVGGSVAALVVTVAVSYAAGLPDISVSGAA